jgi:hypothetical protein
VVQDNLATANKGGSEETAGHASTGAVAKNNTVTGQEGTEKAAGHVATGAEEDPVIVEVSHARVYLNFVRSGGLTESFTGSVQDDDVYEMIDDEDDDDDEGDDEEDEDDLQEEDSENRKRLAAFYNVCQRPSLKICPYYSADNSSHARHRRITTTCRMIKMMHTMTGRRTIRRVKP